MRQEGRPYISLGSGTNCLFAFDFFEGLLIKSALKGWKFENNELITASGEGVSALASQLGFATLIPWVGLPGTF
jgi:UDP-N-acetylenolpyruvoylglucosamine reductase